MFDINFIQKTDSIRKKIIDSKIKLSSEYIFEEFEKNRSRRPFVFNVETTNVCNMKCIMCPRTKLMKRKIETMDMNLFNNIIKQIKIHSKDEIRKFQSYVKENYGIAESECSENAFYFNMSSTYLTLHGYGEPLLDPLIIKRIKACSENKIPTYFSCVPANIDLDKINELMESGLGVLKFSLDSLSDSEQKRIRGKNNNFEEAYKKILMILKLKEEKNYQTKIVITLINLSENIESKTMQKRFMELWKNKDVFAYVKSQDNKWLYQEDKDVIVRSHYETGYCEFPWSSMTIMVDGTVVPCTQDYNMEMALGDANKESLEDIWNSKKYEEFRMKHITGEKSKELKCVSRCDIKKVFERRNLMAS
ncbi:MAG: hypothetical protein ACD_79C00287G0012 [uncultured bacterium]|nr:MAG: hypothetical protein ACD_79C00287G0012 [uncultured bacterium]